MNLRYSRLQIHFSISKKDFEIPFVCGATELSEAVRRIYEGAAMIRTKGEAGTGNVVAAVTHARIIDQEIKQLQNLDDDKLSLAAESIISRYRVLADKSSLPGTYDMTPFGPINDDMHNEVVGILSEVKKFKGYLS